MKRYIDQSMNFRLDDETLASITTIADKKKWNKSQVTREALRKGLKLL